MSVECKIAEGSGLKPNHDVCVMGDFVHVFRTGLNTASESPLQPIELAYAEINKQRVKNAESLIALADLVALLEHANIGCGVMVTGVDLENANKVLEETK